MARKGTNKTDKNYRPPIPLGKAKKIIKEVNIYKRKKGVNQPFKNQDYAISQLLLTIDLFNNNVDRLITNSTLTPISQKKYYEKLKKRLSRLLEFIQEEPDEYFEEIYNHQMNTHTLNKIAKKKDGGTRDDIIILPVTTEKFIETLKIYIEANNHLYNNPINKNRKDNHRDDLRHLIDLLFEMYIKCSGRTPGYTYNKDKKYKGDFVLLVELVIPYVKPPFDIKPTNEAIGEGVKLYTKHSL